MTEAEAMYTSAVQRVRDATAQREHAICDVALVAAEELAGELTAAVNNVLTIEARLLSLRGALLARTGSDNNHAALAAERLTTAIQSAKRAAGVEYDLTSGPLLLNELAVNPAARL
jgi:hypothetical protein